MSAPDWTVTALTRALAAREVTASEVCAAYLDRAEASQDHVNAFTAVLREEAMERAADVDKHLDEWHGRPLLGVPVTVKDVICTKAIPTTGASRILANFQPPYDATVVTRLRQAGAIVIGKTNCDEFAMGSSTEHSAYGVTRNPWNLDRVPGGSSGGAAAAVAARLAPASIASDTGGSIRQPAAFCGVVGLKPTYGRVSRYGLLAFASSLDQIGPITLTVADSARVFGCLTGQDPCDATTVEQPHDDFGARLPGDARGARIGIPRSILAGLRGVDDEALQAFNTTIETLERLGARCIDIELPHLQYAIPAYYLIAPAEASSNLARYDGVRYGFRARTTNGDDGLTAMYTRTRNEGFGPEVKRRIMLGTYALSAGYYDAYYRKAQQVRQLIAADYEDVFKRVDAVAMPTTPAPAFGVGERVDDPLAMYLGDIFTVSANLTGLPAISLPGGFTDDGLPLGFQLMARPFDEATLFRLGDAYERESPWWRKLPTALSQETER